ncbi:Cadherin-related hmr-1 [Toxocara canis]|uniref:Cadherin-related hmr-1 n=1 Tax=Toxocara canis TaxID=6265 RepID=A0A0B2VZW3_TOXCA|nr:Cadherin-related hmr-1 [Toxocara canis]
MRIPVTAAEAYLNAVMEYSHGASGVVLECVNKELGYTPDLADVWDKAGLREAWVFISDTEKEYPFIGGILLVDALKKARRLPNQVGGLAPLSGNDKYPAAVTGRTQSYMGCVRNLFISSELYDLGVPGFASNEHTQMGCDLSEAVCDLNSIRGGYCIHGECIADAVVIVYIDLLRIRSFADWLFPV